MKTKTTISIDRYLMREGKAQAARQDPTISALIERALREAVRDEGPVATALPPLPSWHLGDLQVDVLDKDALHGVLDER